LERREVLHTTPRTNKPFHTLASLAPRPLAHSKFNYYYLYLHKNYVRGIVAFIFLSVTSSIPYFIYNLYLRLLILGLLMLTLYFNNTIMMDEAFWIADWGMGACWMFLGLSGMGMLAFDEVAGENRTQNTSSLHPLVGAWIIYTAAWSNLTGTVWRKKVMLILVCMVTISVHLLTNLFGREYLNGMEGYAPRLDFDNVQAVVLLGVLTIAVLIISWIVEGHIRMQFMNSWDLLLKKIEQEELLQKQRFSVEQLEIIRNIMENKNEVRIDGLERHSDRDNLFPIPTLFAHRFAALIASLSS
jgi:hypothetical protein